MHSYGGFSGPVAANALSKTEMDAKGESGGIIGMIMMAAFVVKEGVSLISRLPGQKYTWIVPDVNTPPSHSDIPLSVAGHADHYRKQQGSYG